ncbi:hypothetical protein LTR50_005043 [Elasticomyces elasticus]|nr:hypothetical protein LTR50_005043 [Elasticomyces elasticus]
MWKGFFTLLGLSTLMAIASFLAGSLPLSFKLSQRQLRLTTALGTGVLVGTALIVIIPEGVETLYGASRASEHGHAQKRSGVDDAHTVPYTPAQRKRRRGSPEEEAPAGSDIDLVSPPGTPDTAAYGREPHAWVGVSLVLGFILMYLIDKIPQHTTASLQPRRFHVSLDRLSMGFSRAHDSPNTDGGIEDAYHASTLQPSGSRPSATTIGLVIHAAADGIALGASSSSSSTRLGFVIFLAIMIHKAPAAFGLTTALLKQGLTKRQARAHLVVFSLAAPVGALATWSLSNLVGGGLRGGEQDTRFATGVLLLFSGGTFLYVAMHTMQDVQHQHAETDEPVQNGYADTLTFDPYRPRQKEGTAWSDTLAAVVGMLVPLLTQFGHAH